MTSVCLSRSCAAIVRSGRTLARRSAAPSATLLNQQLCALPLAQPRRLVQQQQQQPRRQFGILGSLFGSKEDKPKPASAQSEDDAAAAIDAAAEAAARSHKAMSEKSPAEAKSHLEELRAKAQNTSKTRLAWDMMRGKPGSQEAFAMQALDKMLLNKEGAIDPHKLTHLLAQFTGVSQLEPILKMLRRALETQPAVRESVKGFIHQLNSKQLDSTIFTGESATQSMWLRTIHVASQALHKIIDSVPADSPLKELPRIADRYVQQADKAQQEHMKSTKP